MAFATQFLKRKKIILLLIFLFILVGTILGLEIITFKFTPLHFVPRDAKYYFSINVDIKEQQVKQARALLERFPGGRKGVEIFKNFNIELLGRPQDPFEDVLSLAKKEIFLAKISPEEERIIVEQLVNIVELESEKRVKEEIEKIKKKEGYIFEEKTYKGWPIYYVKRPELETPWREIILHPLPYRVTVPLAEDSYLTVYDRFIISGDKKEDIQKIIEIIKPQTESILRRGKGTILIEKDYKEISKHFPKNYLVRFYQKQEIIPHMIFPIELLIGPLVLREKPEPKFFSKLSAAIVGNIFGIFEKEEEREEKTKIARAFTIEAKEEGMVFTFYQPYEIEIREIFEKLKDAFLLSQVLAREIPEEIKGREISIYIETKNIKRKIESLRETIKELAEKTKDEQRKRRFEFLLKAIDEFFKGASEFLGVDFEKDILSWMDEHSAFFLAPGFDGAYPIGMLVFRVKEPEKVREKLEKISIESPEAKRIKWRDERRVRDLKRIKEALYRYYVEQNFYPESLLELKKYIYWLPKDPKTWEFYPYQRLNEKEFLLYANLEDGRKYLIEVKEGEIVKEDYEGESKLPERIRPEKIDYKGINIYKLKIFDEFYIYFSIFSKKVIFIHDLEALKEIIDFKEGKSFYQSKKFNEQFRKAPKIIGGIYFIEPYGFWGIAESFYTGWKSLEDEIGYDYSLLIKTYLKTLKHIGGYYTLKGKTIVNPTLFWIEEAPEKKEAEAVLEKFLKRMEVQKE